MIPELSYFTGVITAFSFAVIIITLLWTHKDKTPFTESDLIFFSVIGVVIVAAASWFSILAGVLIGFTIAANKFFTRKPKKDNHYEE